MAFWREPTAEERSVLALAEIDDGLKRGERAYTARIREFHAQYIGILGRWIREGQIEAIDLADPDTITTFPGRERLREDLVGLLGELAEFGFGQAERELAKMRKGPE